MKTAARWPFAIVAALGLLSGCSGGDAEGTGGAGAVGGTGGTRSPDAPVDRSDVSFVDNLLAKVEAGEWTLGEGLVATLEAMAGERDATSILLHPELLNYEGTGIVKMAYEYLVDLRSDLTGGIATPDVAVGQDGSAVAVWVQSDGALNNIWANRYVPGNDWGTAKLIETGDTGHANWPNVAVDADGDAVAVWHQSDGTRANIWANQYVAGQGWATAELIESEDLGDALRPKVAVDPDGNAIAVWYQDDGMRLNVWANRLE